MLLEFELIHLDFNVYTVMINSLFMTLLILFSMARIHLLVESVNVPYFGVSSSVPLSKTN